ncbi:nucleobase-ascorbate transporter 3-like [Malus sylvestris]|uniref:nucleobase-ascorbate transporter 3-like n=1 Tax=Malus sylvestris TaxID=3752 RepID=UPI0021AC4E9A|nr:nucleobase-ascorbate transporter 3-like [Malus sylvestris]
MLGSIVIIATSFVPRMGGDHGDKARVIQTMLFMAAINTLIQTFIGTRLPTVMTSSFAFTLPVMSIINDYSDRNFRSEHEIWHSITVVDLLSVFPFHTFEPFDLELPYEKSEEFPML